MFVQAWLCVCVGLLFRCCWESQLKHGVVLVLRCVFNVLGNCRLSTLLCQLWVVFAMLLGIAVSAGVVLVLGWLANVVGNRSLSTVLSKCWVCFSMLWGITV